MCRAELRGLGAVHEKLAAAGGSVLAISVDPPEKSRAVAASDDLPFPILSDRKAKVIRDYGVLHEQGMGSRDIAIPANFLINGDGEIAWSYVSTRTTDRAAVEDVQAHVDELIRSEAADPT